MCAAYFACGNLAARRYHKAFRGIEEAYTGSAEARDDVRIGRYYYVIMVVIKMKRRLKWR